MCKVKFLIYLIWKLNKVQIAKTEKKKRKERMLMTCAKINL